MQLPNSIRRSLELLCIGGILAAVAPVAPASAETRLGSPVQHANLAVYPVLGPSAPGPVPLTLQEALATGAVEVEETGNVRQLRIENKGDRPVFVQFGDLVKGGRQDRVLTMSLLVPPRSGKVAIGAYCVEQGRWSARGKEDVARFSASDSQLTSRKAKVAIVAPDAAPPVPNVAEQRRATEPFVMRQPIRQQERAPASSQGEIWRSVGETQGKLRDALAAPVASDKSRTSLQLTLESERLKAALTSYMAALETALVGSDEVVGVVIAINGGITSADVYPSSALFRKMWPKLLRASATEAIAAKVERAQAAPTREAALAFLKEAEAGKATERTLQGVAKHETRRSKAAVRVEARSADGAWVHRNYLAQ